MLEAQIAAAVREAFIREGIDTRDLYIVTETFEWDTFETLTASIKIVGGDFNQRFLSCHLREVELNVFEVI